MQGRKISRIVCSKIIQDIDREKRELRKRNKQAFLQFAKDYKRERLENQQ
jgi:hypothetical protein